METNKPVEWKVFLKSPRERVFEFLTTDQGRTKFWAESAIEAEGCIRFKFTDGRQYKAHIIEQSFPDTFALEYFHSLLIFHLADYGNNHGTDLVLINKNIPESKFKQVETSWISFLMALKSAVDFGIDIRSHDPRKNWSCKYIDN